MMTDRGTGVSAWPVVASVGGGALLMADVVIGRAYGNLSSPALLSGAVVVAAVAVAARELLFAALAASLASLGATAWVQSSAHLSAQFVLPGMAEVAGLCLLTGWALRSLPPWIAAGAASATTAALAGVFVRGPQRSYEPLLVLAVGLALTVAVAVGLYLRWVDHDRARDGEAARQDERLTIARELHDVVAHYVTGMVVQAQAAQLVWDERPRDARRAVEDIESAGSEALEAMRRMITALRGDLHGPLVPVATLDDLEELADRSAARGLPVRLHLLDVPERMPAAVGASVHRIVQEAITNAQQHATGATSVDVRITATSGGLSVVIDDDGRPGTRARRDRRGYGVVGMTERAEALGGRLSAGPSAEGGWSVRLELPAATS